MDDPILTMEEREAINSGRWFSTLSPSLRHDILRCATVKRYKERGFTNLMVCFGCTGGQHRSVYSAQHMAEHINKKFNVKVELVHREQNIEQTFNAKIF